MIRVVVATAPVCDICQRPFMDYEVLEEKDIRGADDVSQALAGMNAGFHAMLNAGLSWHCPSCESVVGDIKDRFAQHDASKPIEGQP